MVQWINILLFSAVLFIMLGIAFLVGSKSRRRIMQDRLGRIAEDGKGETGYEGDLIRNVRYSDIPYLERVFNMGKFGTEIRHFLTQAGVSLKVGPFILLSLILAVLGWLIGSWMIENALVGIGMMFLFGAIPFLVVARKRQKRLLKFMEQFPDALELLANALRAGLALSGGMRIVAREMPEPVGGEFWIVSEEHNLGLDIKEALVRLSHRMDIQDVKLFVTAVILQKETGGNLVEILENTTSIIRDRFRILSEARVFSAQGRLSGIVLVMLPIVMIGVISILMPEYLKILVEDPIGKYLITAAAALQLIGILTIRKIVRIRV